MQYTNRLKYSGLIALIFLVIVAGLTLASNAIQAQSKSPLARLALRFNEAELRVAGPTNADDVSQPLNRLNTLGRSAQVETFLFAYEEAYKVEALKGGVYIGNYLYQYPDQAQAEAVARAVSKTILQNHAGSLLLDKPQIAGSDISGQSGMFVGAEGDAVFWFVGVKERTLALLMVNGLAAPATQHSFESLMARLLQRLNDK